MDKKLQTQHVEHQLEKAMSLVGAAGDFNVGQWEQKSEIEPDLEARTLAISRESSRKGRPLVE